MIWDHDNEEWIMDEAERDQREFIADDPTCVWDMIAQLAAEREEINFDEVPF